MTIFISKKLTTTDQSYGYSYSGEVGTIKQVKKIEEEELTGTNTKLYVITHTVNGVDITTQYNVKDYLISILGA